MWLYAFIVLLILIIVWFASRDDEVRHHGRRAKNAVVAAMPASMASAMPAAADAPAAPAVAPVAAVTAAAPAPTVGGATVVAAATAAAPKEKFCPKLAHRYGFCDAGARPETMNPSRGTFYDSAPMAALPMRPNYFQGFLPVRNPDARTYQVEHPADGTMWSGYMHGSVLPM